MKHSRLLFAAMMGIPLTLLPVSGLAETRAKGTTAKTGHPKVTEQEKLLPCHECHKTRTPKVYEEWTASTHGIANVKCYQCHGTYENMVKTPDLSNCAVCHGSAFDHSEGKKCWECHPAHQFVAKQKGQEVPK